MIVNKFCKELLLVPTTCKRKSLKLCFLNSSSFQSEPDDQRLLLALQRLQRAPEPAQEVARLRPDPAQPREVAHPLPRRPPLLHPAASLLAADQLLHHSQHRVLRLAHSLPLIQLLVQLISVHHLAHTKTAHLHYSRNRVNRAAAASLRPEQRHRGQQLEASYFFVEPLIYCDGERPSWVGATEGPTKTKQYIYMHTDRP